MYNNIILILKMYNCEFCGKNFKRKYNYERHINRKNFCNNNKEYKCEKCFKIFDHKGDYKKHLNRQSDCSMDKYKILQNNYKMQLDLLSKDNKILKKKIEKLENIIKTSTNINYIDYDNIKP